MLWEHESHSKTPINQINCLLGFLWLHEASHSRPITNTLRVLWFNVMGAMLSAVQILYMLTAVLMPTDITVWWDERMLYITHKEDF